MRTSSINPSKNSPDHTEFPPIRTGFAVWRNTPDTAVEPTNAPSRYIRIVDPSDVTATCTHVAAGNGAPSTTNAKSFHHEFNSGPEAVTYNAYANPPGRSFINNVCHEFKGASGRTHASNVIPDVKSNDAESATVTQSSTPSNDNARPNRPPVTRAAPDTVPTFPRPDESVTAAPETSSKPNPMTRSPTGPTPR